MSNTQEGRPLAELIGGLAGDISSLFRKEIQLAKAEASEKLSDTIAGVVSLLIGAVLALGALGVLLAGIVTIVVGIIAYVFVNRGLNALKASNLNMNRTAASLSRDADIVKERL